MEETATADDGGDGYAQTTELEWEIGVRISHDHDTWDFYHPTAATEEEAKEKALDEARSPGIGSIGGIGDPLEVYIVSGPWDSDGNRVEVDGGEGQA